MTTGFAAQGRPRGGNILTIGEIDELKRRGLSEAEIARRKGTSRQAVNWHVHFYGGSRTPRQQVLERFPVRRIPVGHSDASIARRLRDHGEWYVTGGVGMSDDSLRRLRGLWRRMHRRGLIAVYDPALPPSRGVSSGGGWALVPRQLDDGRLMLRDNEHAEFDDAARLVWTLPPVSTIESEVLPPPRG